MENFTAIEYHQTRDFSRKMNVTIEFIKQNFKSLGKGILFIAGPPILIASMLVGSFYADVFNFSAIGQNPNLMMDKFSSPSFWLQLFAMMVFFMVAFVSAIATINNYIVLYEEKKTNHIEVHEIWERVRKSFMMNLGTLLLFVVLAFACYFILIIPVVLLTAISPWLLFFGFIIMMCGIMYFFVGASFVFIIRTYERIGFFDALTRSFRLIQGKWWSTFGLLFVLTLVIMAVSWVIIMPWYAVMISNSLHSITSGEASEPSETYRTMTVIVFAVYYLVQMLLYALPHVGLAFQYFNLVERKEARGLMSQINAFGQANTSAGSAQEEQY